MENGSYLGLISISNKNAIKVKEYTDSELCPGTITHTKKTSVSSLQIINGELRKVNG